LRTTKGMTVMNCGSISCAQKSQRGPHFAEFAERLF
jgi:hypothetical protein